MKELNYEEFMKEVRSCLQERMGEDVRIDIHETVKNNNVTYKGISVLKTGCNVSPNLRLDDFYSFYLECQDLDRVLQKMVKIFEKNQGKNMDMDCFTDFERAKDRIIIKLVSYGDNKERLKNLPHMRFLDLAVIYCYCMEQGCLAGGTASIQIETEHLKYWQINEIMLHKIAMKNSQRMFPPQIHTMHNILAKMMREKDIDPEQFQDEMEDMQKQLPMYVLTNPQNYFGAAALYYPDVLKKTGREFGADLIILPSSVHEVIILPVVGDENFEELNQLIREINENQLADEEVLSDHLYYYDREKEKLIIPSVIL